jgi:hypothetical protein
MEAAVPISARRCAVILGLGVALLVAASLGVSLLSFVVLDDPSLSKARDSVVRLLWIDEEGNIPAWYSASLLLVSSLLLAAIAAVHRHQRRGHVAHWLILSLVFLFLSLDETAQLHERSIVPLRDAFGATGFLYYAWIVPAAVCVLALGLGYLRFLSRLPARTARLFLLAAGVYLGGAIGIEAISANHASLLGEKDFVYHLIVSAEELFEMTGVVLFIYALLEYMGRQFTSLTLHVVDQ